MRWHIWAAAALLGIAINVATGGHMTPAALTLVVAFLLMGVWMGWSALTYQRRTKVVRGRIWGVQAHPG